MLLLFLLIFSLAICLILADKLLAVKENKIIIKIEELLPQTQCGQCGYPGCKPYAQALAEGKAEINQCRPGGQRVINQLADLLGKNITTPKQEKQSPRKIIIDEEKCIGCTKCIQVCPTDCIVGAIKHMHTIIQKDCTQCELCLPVCPVDCIDIVAINEKFRYKKNV